MFAGVAAGMTTPASAATYTYSVHPSIHVTIHHPRHWRQHLFCKTHWRHHHKVRVCIWVPDHHHHR